MIEIKKPRIECIETQADPSYGKFIIEPLERGYGTTLGNSLRRVLLSSLPGSAVWRPIARIAGVPAPRGYARALFQDMPVPLFPCCASSVKRPGCPAVVGSDLGSIIIQGIPRKTRLVFFCPPCYNCSGTKKQSVGNKKIVKPPEPVRLTIFLFFSCVLSSRKR